MKTDTIILITEAYTQVADGRKKVVFEEDLVKVTAYWAGTIIRIDILDTQMGEGEGT